MTPEHSWWINRYSTGPPLGHALRRAFPDRWLRIHSLPDAQRYPSNEGDWKTLRMRHRRVCEALFSTGQTCFLATPWSCATDSCFSGFSLAPADHLPGFQPDLDAPPTGPFHFSAFQWDFDAILPILEAVAEWKSLASFFSFDGSLAYCPYDGGADLILAGPKDRDLLRLCLSDITSPMRGGL